MALGHQMCGENYSCSWEKKPPRSLSLKLFVQMSRTNINI